MTQSSQISSSHGFADGQNAAAKESKLSGKKMLNMKYIWVRLRLAWSHLYPFLFIFKHFNDWSVVWCQANVDLQHNQMGQTFGSVPHCFCSIFLYFCSNGGWTHDIISRSCQPYWFPPIVTSSSKAAMDLTPITGYLCVIFCGIYSKWQCRNTVRTICEKGLFFLRCKCIVPEPMLKSGLLKS